MRRAWPFIALLVLSTVWGPHAGRLGQGLAVVAAALGGMAAITFLLLWAVAVWPRADPPLWNVSEDCLERYAGPKWSRRP